ncbi:GNAT family N-acetyltransferase [Streptomyces sp. NPDC059696]|uniref:GNAT family N-acetyltransferase n=1 Tax=Streptomyces sp. NPDC059696 TaxID=3346911 RepID=UPI0036797937
MSASVELLTDTPAGPVQVTSPVPRATWWDVVGRDAAAQITQTPPWLDCLCATGAYRDAGRLYEFEGGGKLVLPLVGRRQRPRWLDEEESWPGGEWGIGGPVFSPGVGETEARAMFDDLARRPANKVGVWFRPGDDALWARSAPAGFRVQPNTAHVLDLEGGFGTVWERRFHQGVRRGVRRAERSDLEVEVDRDGRLVPDFYQLFEQSIPRWAKQDHEPLALARWRRMRIFPPSRLETIAARLGPSCTIWMARRGGEPAAAIVVLRHGGHALYWRGAMNRELAHPARASHLLHRLAIEDACAAGCEQYDMGVSVQGSTLRRFKESFGTDAVPSPRYYRERLPFRAPRRGLRWAVLRAVRFRGT